VDLAAVAKDELAVQRRGEFINWPASADREAPGIHRVILMLTGGVFD